MPDFRPRRPSGVRDSSDHARRALYSVCFLFVLMATGVVGYRFIEGWTWLQSTYMVVITLSTVGFKEVQDLSEAGRAFTIFFITMGAGTVGFAVAQLVEFSLEGHLGGMRRRHRMQKVIESLREHTIVCGYGRVGQEVTEELRRKGRPVLVIDLDPPEEELQAQGIPSLRGNASSEELLRQAGIEHAICLVAAMDSDTENVFTILTARELKPGIHLVARASERDTTRKLKMVGADRVVSPYVTSGRRMAAMALHPEVVDFLDYFTQPLEEIELELSTIEVVAGSELDGTSLKQADLRRRSGAMVLAVRSAGRMLFNPEAEMILEAGMRLMVLGRQDQVRRLEEIAGGG